MITNGSVRQMVPGPLALFEAAFRAELSRVGYTSRSARDLVQAMARLSRWPEDKALPVSGLTPEVVTDLRTELRQVGPVLRFLRGVGALGGTAAVAGAGPVEALLAEFRWSGSVACPRSRCAATGQQAGVFLAGLPAPLDAALQRLGAGLVTSFMLEFCGDRNTESAKAMVTAVRTLLRFCMWDAHVPVPLTAAVPSVAGWRPGRVAAQRL